MTSEAIETYLNWITENGGTFRNIELRTDNQGVGCVHTTADIQEDEKFASVPFKLAITEPVARKAFPSLSKFSGRIVLSIFLAQEKKREKESFYWPYIQILPETIMTPLYFDESDMNYIKNTNLELATKERKSNLMEEYKEAVRNLTQNDISWDEFLWAYTVYSSRAFPYTLIDPTSKSNSEVLFPLVDALNHKPNTKITWERSGDIETGSLSFISGQLSIQLSNEELLLGYGFCFEYNDHDHITIKPNFKQDPDYETKLKILQQCHITSGNADPYTFYMLRNSIPPSFFQLMRVLVMNTLELEYYFKCTQSEYLDFVGYRNELSVILTITTILKSRLRNITSISLDKDNHKEWQTFALMYRAGQEDVYRAVLSKMEEVKRNLIQKMAQDLKENKLANRAPFLSIHNPEIVKEKQEDNIELDSSPFLSLDMVLIDIRKLLAKDKAFSDVISELFEDFEQEADMIMMLWLQLICLM
ncbi:SET domain-containing protein [Backusella circina FSU 941]|nr:SET domain-containing protein [Backusella circina FSU 941]